MKALRDQERRVGVEVVPVGRAGSEDAAGRAAARVGRRRCWRWRPLPHSPEGLVCMSVWRIKKGKNGLFLAGLSKL